MMRLFWTACYWLTFIAFPFLWFGALFVGPSEYFFQKMRQQTPFFFKRTE